ncbi:hypothetical protein C5167_024308 [Papaver somniferum]|uniref:Uncharacterized protein n=1 Tax=Papaver somniferum TaxID=3469 RepID=A0A4Y7JPS1_PAPSO|nr:hypothetical protein C5167_024308 [Papaver somniferum]
MYEPKEEVKSKKIQKSSKKHKSNKRTHEEAEEEAGQKVKSKKLQKSSKKHKSNKITHEEVEEEEESQKVKSKKIQKSSKKHNKRTHEEVEEEGQKSKFDPVHYFASTKFITKRRAGLYYICKDEEITKVERFKVDGHDDGKAESYLESNYDRTHIMDIAVMHMEEAMVEGCESGQSGGMITIDCIDHNNTITNVCEKDIEQLRQEKLQRDKAFYDANSKRTSKPVLAKYDMWG